MALGSLYQQIWNYRKAVAINIAAADHVLTSTDPAAAVPGACRALYVGGAGNVVVILAGDSASVTFNGVPAGTTLPIQVGTVVKTATTATNMVALY